MKVLDHLAATFREEAAERIVELESTLLELEVRPADAELVDRAFRAMHTIKGSGAMFGFEEIAAFTHELETVFDEVRNGRLSISAELVDLALASKDLIRAMLDGCSDDVAADRARLVEALRQHQRKTTAAPVKIERGPAKVETFRIQFKPRADLFQDGTNPMGLLAELHSLGRCELIAHTRAIPPLAELAPEECYVSWDAILTTDKGATAIRDVFMFVEDRCQLGITLIDEESVAIDSEYKKLGEILVDRGDLRPQDLERTLAERKRIGDVLAENGLVSLDAVEAAAVEQKVVRSERARRSASSAPEASSSIRVAPAKLDHLVDLVGELVIAQARLSRIASQREDPELMAVAEDMERLSASLRDGTLDVRMVPIGSTFNGFKRLVRDLSTELGKQIDLVTDGAETELDKTVMERLGDPLVHLIRNSCGHGIEPSRVRAAAGKPARGTVRLSARQAGGSVIIEIGDDGGGLDPVAIRAKALDRGLIAADAELTEKELFNLVFLPGFSTASEVSNLSGRGVGMDVVKRSIEGLRGSVCIDSTLGAGATVRITLPLTLAIIEGLLVSVRDAVYVLPLSIVEECIELTREEAGRNHGASLAAVRGELVPYLRLRDLFAVQGERPGIEQIVIVTAEGGRYGLAVDGVIGQHQTVIKSMGRMYRDVKGLSGATILGDGTVALILDVPALVQRMATSAAVC